MSIYKPKRILSLDGGGIRGALTLGFLEKIEKEIQRKESKKNLRLCDYFDLIGGTSTGAIIAAGLSIGMKASEITKLYLDIGDKIFGKKRKWFLRPLKRYYAEFDFRPLEKALLDVFGNITIGSNKIKTGLCIVTKRADTLSTWPIINNPKGKYFKNYEGMLLRKIVRASAAAPSYFAPQKIDIGFGETGTFIDGGVSLANNPALQLFLVTTLDGFPYKWELGENKLSILSLGTGTYTKRYNPDKIAKKGLLGWAKMIPELFMEDANYFNQAILQYLSNSPTAKKIDSEIIDLKEDLITEKPLLQYIRYDVLLEMNELNSIGVYLEKKMLRSLREMSHSANKEILYHIGKKAAEKFVKSNHIK